jgi:hypothetical protein
MGIPYQAIGIGIGFLLGILAFIEADTINGRIFIVSAMIVIFLLPVFWRTGAASIISFICWIVFGIGCYIFLKLRGAGVR